MKAAAVSFVLQSALSQHVAESTGILLSSSEELGRAIEKVSLGASCSNTYRVSPSLVSTLTYDGDYLDGRGVDFRKGGVALAWLVGNTDIEAWLNSDCCDSSVRSLPQCFCKIAYDVGLRSEEPAHLDESDYLDYSRRFALVFSPSKQGMTQQVSRPGELDLISPSWEHLVGLMPDTFEHVFSSLPIEDRPRCSLDSEQAHHMAEILKNSTLQQGGEGHPDSWQVLAQANPDMLHRLGASLHGPDGVTIDTLAAVGDELCSDPLAVRTYMWFALDANDLFLGTGVTAGGSDEIITCPNVKLASLPDAYQVKADRILPDGFCSSPDAVHHASIVV